MLDWITNTIDSLGYIGIALLMCLENVFPPIPSEVIMPLSGFVVAQGELKLPWVILSGIIGSVIGTLPWYFLGKSLGLKKLKAIANQRGKWLGLSGKDVERAQNWFHHRGEIAVGIGRLVPGIRTYISIPAGINQMQLLPYLIYSSLGTALWLSFLAYAGYVLGDNYERVRDYLAPISRIVWISLILGFGVWVVRRLLQQRQHKSR
ncbi:MAG: DedA family protein [Thermosynechococcaceae cyanobacterium]